MTDIDDGSTKPLGHQTDDGELEVREQDGERMYHETDLGQHMRWMRQAPDLFEKYQALEADRDVWKRAWAALFETLTATHDPTVDRACHSFHGDENCLLAGPHEGVSHVSLNGVQWTE